MNGIHDMGGMHGMGPIEYEKAEPVFHEQWEGRVYALRRLTPIGRPFNLDAARHQLERIPPAEYLRMSYYERWFVRLVDDLLTNGIVTDGELESGHALADTPKAEPPIKTEMIPAIVTQRNSARRNVAVSPRFVVGQLVRALNINPAGHTRLPRYARGKTGEIMRDHGVFLFPDTNAAWLGEKPQHVYSVRFAARELWGEDASPRDSIYLDLWDDYLEAI